ncbi:hypothetical protein QYM36_012153 [Artemia franciscana]|uniref:PiggyBac transposable element-derived protein domain-containing protein n=1 Tax=Artemia franciscana TaxID=6661 RepID=A0AA88HL15_ARTSF|nr:hypothetical protein QYM36_012153 [Artemia franciscana]
MGVFNLPQYRMYWGTRTRIPLITDMMNFNRFSRLRSFVHMVDNASKDPDNLDRLWKVRPIIDIVQKKTQTISLSEHLSCDEQMVPFTGNLDIKQYIRGKPCPWGIKIFVLCNADGRVLSFEIYQGKKTNMAEDGAVNKVCRWCKQTKAYLQVDQPQVVSLYNQYMGGVDKMDQMLSYYQTFIRSKKWTMRLIFHMVDLSICNSWLEYVADRKAKAERSMDLLSFRTEIAEALTSAEGMTPRRRGRPRSLTSSEEDEHENVDESASRKRKLKFQRPCSAVKNDAFSHWPQKVKGQSRYKNSPCVLKTRTMCLKCNVPLCLEEDRNCFKEFHIKK